MAFLNFLEGDQDWDFVFPLTVTLEDGTSLTLNSEDELEDLIDECLD